MVLLLKTHSMQQSFLWERLIFLYNCQILPIEELIFSPNIGVDNLTKNSVLQLKESNLPLTLYLLNEQFLREKHVLGHMCHRLDN